MIEKVVPTLKTMILALFLTTICISSVPAMADDDTYVQIQEIVNDLGGPALQKKNNGKVQACADKGTKKITITKKNGSTTYKAVYKECVEYGRKRSGSREITTN